MEGKLNNPSGAIVQVAQELMDKLRKDVNDAQLKAEALRQELEAERAKTTDEQLAECYDLIEALKAIADHHCANLSPEFIRDMPAEEIDTAARLITKIGRATQRDSERAGVWAERANLIRWWRENRRARDLATEMVAKAEEKKRAKRIERARAAKLRVHAKKPKKPKGRSKR